MTRDTTSGRSESLGAGSGVADSSPVGSLDTITLTGLRAFGRHGVFDFERENGQEFVIDLALGVSTKRAARTDDVADTVHYGELAEKVVAIVGGEPVNLIETLAHRIADAVMRDARVRFLAVTVHKPHAPIPAQFQDVAVTVHATRDENGKHAR